jgi:predicted nucleic acid-binding protein
MIMLWANGLDRIGGRIITVTVRARATMLLSEDMQYGLEVDGLRVVNPFVTGNDGVIAEFLS